MPLGGSLYQLVLAFLLGVVWAVRGRSPAEAAALGAKASFVLGAALMLFSEARWWPVTASMVALVTWVASGWLTARLGGEMVGRVRSFWMHSSTGADDRSG